MPAHERFSLLWSKKTITIITTSLVAIAIISISLVLYQQYIKSQSPVKITKEEAINMALSEAKKMSFQPLFDTVDANTILAQLIHVDENALGIVVDENWMTDTFTMTDRWPPIYKNHYLWQVKIVGSRSDNADIQSEWESVIDAVNGSIIGSSIDGSTIFQTASLQSLGAN